MIGLGKVADLKVLMIGDDITDRYTFVNVVGKSAKDAALAGIFGKQEDYTGGIHAAAAHIRGLCGQVDVWTGSSRVTSQKFVEDAHYRKVFSLHLQGEAEETPLPDVRAYDLVIVIDFGHGTMTKPMIQKVTKEARFLAVNAQTNAVNYGYNLVTRYPKAHYVVLDELEARLATGMRTDPVEEVILALDYKRIVVTRGKAGAVGFDGAFERMSAYTNVVIDNIGAGDAFLAVTAPFAAIGASMKDLLAIGNAAGAAKCGIVGHRRSITLHDLERYLYGEV